MRRTIALWGVVGSIALPLLAGADTHVYVRGNAGWAPAGTAGGPGVSPGQPRTPVPGETPGPPRTPCPPGTLTRVHLDPRSLGGDKAYVLIADNPVDVRATEPPVVATVTLNRHDYHAPLRDLGFLAWPRTVAILLSDPQTPITTDSVKVSLVGDRSGPATYQIAVTPYAKGHYVRVLLTAPDLAADLYSLTVSASDALANAQSTRIRFNTLGAVIPATSWKVLDSSGKVAKPLDEIDTMFYRGEELGDFVTYGFTVRHAGYYGVSIHFTRNPTYGTYRVRLDSDPCPDVLDGYSYDLGVGAGSIAFGRMTLSAGEHRLRFDLLGKQSETEGRYLGVTEIILRPAREPQRPLPVALPPTKGFVQVWR